MTALAAPTEPQEPAVRSPRTPRRQWLAVLGAAARTTRGRVGLGIMLFIALVTVIGPFVTPYSSTAIVGSGLPFAKPSAQYLLGTDVLSRDVLSRVLDGGWVMLVMALCSTVFGVVVGGAAGISAAYLRGKWDGIIMRTVDVVLAFPQLVFALLFVSIIGPKLWLIVIVVGFTQAPAVARVLRSATLDISERDYVKAIELQGVKPVKVMWSEILPNLITPLMVEAGLRLTYSIVVMAGLAFLGFGQPPPSPQWGYMINENRGGLIGGNVWAVVAPTILIALLTIGTNTFTDAVARVAIGIEGRPQEALVLNEAAVAETTLGETA